jgi:hypothetical protein
VKIRFVIGKTSRTATLDNSEASRDFASLLGAGDVRYEERASRTRLSGRTT